MSREIHLRRALRLSYASVGFGAASGAVSVGAGLAAHSLGVLGSGLAVLTDVSGSVVLIWRFRVERHAPERAAHVEARAAAVIATALGVVSVALGAESISALIAGSHPGSSALTEIVSGVSIVVLFPLAWRKRITAIALDSEALKGDSTRSAIGASTAVLALLGLVLFRAFGWWWADRVVALIVAAVAAGESLRTVRALRS